MTPLLIGIDPGKGGALAFLKGDLLAVHDCPLFKPAKGPPIIDIAAIDRMFDGTGWNGGSVHAVIERAQAFPGEGVSSSFQSGLGYGVYLALLTAARIPYTVIGAAEWKRHFRIPGKDKEAARAAASRLLPAWAHLWPRKCHHGRAEAALIALFGRDQLGLLKHAA